MSAKQKSMFFRTVHIIVIGAMVLSPAAIAAKKGGGGGGGGQGGGGGGKGGGKGGPAHTYSGQGTVVSADVLGLETIISDTGPLPSSGGALEKSLLEVNAIGLGTLEVAHAATVGKGNASRSEASVASLNLNVSGVAIGATFVMSRASAICTAGTATVSGSSQLVALQIAGQSIAVSGQPNQTVSIPLPLLGKVVTVIINEQISSASGGTGSITVNALHVIVQALGINVAEVVVSSAHADIVCANEPPCDGDDFITGGGWITGTPSGAKGNFGVAGGIKNGGFWGHLTYIDHGSNGVKVKGTGVTAYVVVNGTTRHIEGTAEINGGSGTYQIDIADNGEPGSSDTFLLLLSSGYAASGTLGGGNIQLHKPSSCN